MNEISFSNVVINDSLASNEYGGGVAEILCRAESTHS